MTDGPQIFSRPGTKRHLKQVRARSNYLAIQAVYAAGKARQAQAAYEAAQAATAKAEAALDEHTAKMLTTLPPQGSA